MAEVSGLTKERMLAIENMSIVEARIEDYNLILTTRGGLDINVGDVRGPKGDDGATPTLMSLGITTTAAKINFVSDVTSAIQAQLNGKSATGHTHDDRYYTEAEITTLLSGKADSAHTHDDRYYTEAEIVTLLGGKMNTAYIALTTEDIDSCTGTAVYYQGSGIGTLALHYPIAGFAGTITNFNAGSRWFQVAQGHPGIGVMSGRMWSRSGGTSLSWTAWQEYATTAEVATKAAASHTHPLSQITTTDIPNAANLNGYTGQGYYSQGANAQAATGVNYPEACAGLLEVVAPNATFIYQRYTCYQGFGGHVYSRSYYNGTWSAWVRLDADADVIGGTVAGCNYYEKYANGLLICRGYKSFAYLSQSFTWTFPVAFVGELPQILHNHNTTAPENLSGGHSSLALASVIIQHYRTTNNSTGMYFSAHGRWK